MTYTKSIEKISPYKPGMREDEIKEKNNLEKVVKLSSNENPYGASKKIKNIYNNIDIERYPDNYCTGLRKALVNKYGLSENNFIFGNGSVEIIQMLSRILIEKDDEVITCIPTFQSYYLETYIQYGKVISIPMTKDYKFDLDAIIANINNRTKIIYIANPNNPTGTIIKNDELANFLTKVSKDILVVLDEAYSEFVTDKDYPNSIELFSKYQNICILKTFSKAYGLANLRIGFGIANAEVINELEKVRVPFNVSGIAEEAAIIALKDENHLKEVVKNNQDVIKYVYSKLNEYNISYIETQTNFIMIDVKKDSNIISQKLQTKGFIVRPNFPNMKTYIRVTIGTMEEMKEFVEVLKQILEEG